MWFGQKNCFQHIQPLVQYTVARRQLKHKVTAMFFLAVLSSGAVYRDARQREKWTLGDKRRKFCLTDGSASILSENISGSPAVLPAYI